MPVAAHKVGADLKKPLRLTRAKTLKLNAACYCFRVAQYLLTSGRSPIDISKDADRSV
jgi:hypothetical protein